MTDSSRRTLLWIVLVIAVGLTVMNIVDLAGGEASWSVWVGLICWPIVAVVNVYQLATNRLPGRS